MKTPTATSAKGELAQAIDLALTPAPSVSGFGPVWQNMITRTVRLLDDLAPTRGSKPHPDSLGSRHEEFLDQLDPRLIIRMQRQSQPLCLPLTSINPPRSGLL